MKKISNFAAEIKTSVEMLNILFQIILSVLIYSSPAPQRMELETIREVVRAEFFAPALSEAADSKNLPMLSDAATLPSLIGEGQSGKLAHFGKNVKRKKAHTSHLKIFQNKCHIIKTFSPKVMARGIARNPHSQDAQQERDAIIRFLHLKSIPVA